MDVEPLGKPGSLEGSLDLDLRDDARDKLAGQARIGSKTGWSRHKHQHKPHKHNPLQQIKIKDCTDVTEKFQTVDAACKTTKQAFAAARAMVRYAPLSDGEPRWEMLRHCASLKELTVEIPVGSSESNAKTVSLPHKLRMVLPLPPARPPARSLARGNAARRGAALRCARIPCIRVRGAGRRSRRSTRSSRGLGALPQTPEVPRRRQQAELGQHPRHIWRHVLGRVGWDVAGGQANGLERRLGNASRAYTIMAYML